MDTLLHSKCEAAEMLGVSLRTLDYLISRGEITARRIGKRVLISRTVLEAFASQIAQPQCAFSHDKDSFLFRTGTSARPVEERRLPDGQKRED